MSWGGRDDLAAPKGCAIVRANGLDSSCEATIYPVLDKPHNSAIQGMGGLKLLEICPPVFKVSFAISLNGRYKYLHLSYPCNPKSVTGDEPESV